MLAKDRRDTKYDNNDASVYSMTSLQTFGTYVYFECHGGRESNTFECSLKANQEVLVSKGEATRNISGTCVFRPSKTCSENLYQEGS